MRAALIGVIGPARASAAEMSAAEEMGRLIAAKGWVLLTGGRDAGVMAAANAGAAASGGLSVGLLPDETGEPAPGVQIVIRTGLGSARNNIIALSADVLVACGAGAGTTSEIALGLKAGKPVVLVGVRDIVYRYFRDIGGELVRQAAAPDEVITMIDEILRHRGTGEA